MSSLPKDLKAALNDMQIAVTSSLKSKGIRFTIEFKFEGLKLSKVWTKLYDSLPQERNIIVSFSDPGSVALAKRDYPNLSEKFYTFKSLTHSDLILDNDLILISLSPQPFDFDTFEPLCTNFNGTHYSINPKFEHPNIGIGSVIRERRKSFIKTWQNVYYLQPLNKGALMHISPNNWCLFKERENKYIFVEDFVNKPDNETIFVNL